MAAVALHTSTGSRQVDAILCGIIGMLELSFPDRVRGYYLDGSYADGSAIAVSDIDLRVVFRGGIDSAERKHCGSLLDCCRLISPYILDVAVESEVDLYRVGSVRLKHTRMLYGEDIRSLVPLKPMPEYIRDIVHNPIFHMKRLRGGGPLVFPLAYPDPADRFFGYTRPVTSSADAAMHYDNKELVLLTTSIATALVALHAEQYVLNKRDCRIQYRRWVHDEWGEFVEAVFDRCWAAWGYRVPAEEHERVLLNELCQRVLAFENHYLARYRSFLLDAVRGDDTALKYVAVRRLAQIRYPDPTVRAALEGAPQGSEGELRTF